MATTTPKSNDPFEMGRERAIQVLKAAKKKYGEESLESGDSELYWAGFYVYLQEASAEAACL